MPPNYTKAIRSFARRKIHLRGLPRPFAWVAGFLNGKTLATAAQEGSAPPPYPAVVDSHYLTFCAGEAIRFEHLFSPLREELARVEGEIQRLLAVPQPPTPDSLAEAARSHREAAARQSQLSALAVQRAQLAELLTQAETILEERALRGRGTAQARKEAYRAGASRRLRRPASLAEGPLPQQWLPLHRRENLEKGAQRTCSSE